jgi:ABC-type uncharacterized transport system substrate-binding protein
VRRQDFITLIGSAALAGSRPARAQQPAKVHRVAYVMTVGSVAEVRESMRAVVFFEEMRRLGYVEGGDLAVEIFSGEGKEEGYAALARHVVQLKPDLIFARDVPMVLHLQLATATIPVVAVTADPASVGIASSLARPGANITGVSVDAGDAIWGKRLELLQETIPGLSRVSFLGTRNLWDSTVGWQARRAAMHMGFALLGSFPEWPPLQDAEYRRLFASMAQESVDAILISDNSENFESRRLIVELAEQGRLPTMSPFQEHAELGGLMTYAPDYREIYRHAARQIDQILKGAQPAKLPFYQATKFELAINLKTAKALGLTIPRRCSPVPTR